MENTLFYGYNFNQVLTDVPWVRENPVTGTILHDNSVQVEVTFTALPTMTVGGVYTATLLLSSDDPVNYTIEIPLTLTVLSPGYSLEVSADQVGRGEPGEVVTYTFTVTNNTPYVSDSYSISLGPSVYDTGLGEAEIPVIVLGPVPAGGSATFVVTVHIPLSALDGDHDSVQITVTSLSDSAQAATIQVTTNVFVIEPPPPEKAKRVYLPLAWKKP